MSSQHTAFKESPRRPHFPGVPGWEGVAEYALDCATNPSAGDLERSAPSAEPVGSER
ncbi:MAG: hypothetical protein AABM43_12825 [Actinomycetota bacterium]